MVKASLRTKRNSVHGGVSRQGARKKSAGNMAKDTQIASRLSKTQGQRAAACASGKAEQGGSQLGRAYLEALGLDKDKGSYDAVLTTISQNLVLVGT